MFQKILWESNSRWKMLGGSLGTVLGLLILMITVEVYYTFNEFLKSETHNLGDNYIIINKKVRIRNMLDMKRTYFTHKELKEIENQDFVVRSAPFLSNHFKVMARFAYQDLPGFYSDLFFEAVPDEFLNIDNKNWKWDENEKLVPIIINRDYLSLYNFGFAESQNLPQVSDNLLRKVKFELTINGSKDKFYGQIIGFTDEINSVLVPEDFLIWANKKFSNEKENKASRVIIEVNDIENKDVYKFLRKNHYEAASKSIISSRLKLVITVIGSVLGIIALVILLLALLIYIYAFQLIIASNKERIIRLLKLGYKSSFISVKYIITYLINILLLNIITLIILLKANSSISDKLYSLYLPLKLHINYKLVLVLLLINAFIIILNILSIRNSIRRLEKKLVPA
jgi:hypothetical protein